MTAAQPQPKSARKKSTAQRLWFLHWLMASFYLLLFITGNYMADLPRDISYRASIYDFHKSLGALVMSLLLARIFVLLLVVQHKYRRRQPKRTRDWFQTVALHTTLYIFMLLVPLSGYIMSNAHGHDVVIFGTGIALPRLVSENEPLGDFGGHAHFWLAYTFLAFIVVHMINQQKYLWAQVRRFFKAARSISSG